MKVSTRSASEEEFEQIQNLLVDVFRVYSSSLALQQDVLANTPFQTWMDFAKAIVTRNYRGISERDFNRISFRLSKAVMEAHLKN